jgi:acylphosphatase
MRVCRHFRVSGRVQGVAFRASALHEARRLGVTGWVRNLPNGDVEALACGDAAALEALERWLWQGPRAARVAAVIAADAPLQAFDGFDIR